MTIEQQYDAFCRMLTSRKRNPPKSSTLNAYKSYYKNWIGPYMGQTDLSEVENGLMKRFVAHLAAQGLSPSSIAGVTQLLKGIVASATDENGNQLHPRQWNSEFVDAPIIEKDRQNTPTISPQRLQEALKKAPSQYTPLLALLAASGLRIAEALALKGNPNSDGSYWDRKEAKLVVRSQIYRGEEVKPKTAAGAREVDLDPAFNEWLMERLEPTSGYLFTGRDETKPLSPFSAYYAIRNLVPGFHSLRRFRITWLENQGVPRRLAMWWTGHASRDIHEDYIRLDKNKELRRDWARRAGLGFTLPSRQESSEQNPRHVSEPMVPQMSCECAR